MAAKKRSKKFKAAKARNKNRQDVRNALRSTKSNAFQSRRRSERKTARKARKAAKKTAAGLERHKKRAFLSGLNTGKKLGAALVRSRQKVCHRSGMYKHRAGTADKTKGAVGHVPLKVLKDNKKRLDKLISERNKNPEKWA